MTPIAARVGGTVPSVPVADNQQVEAGTDAGAARSARLRDRRRKARPAELADAEAAVVGARATVPVTSTTASSHVSTAQGGVSAVQSGISEAEHGIDVGAGAAGRPRRRDCAK